MPDYSDLALDLVGYGFKFVPAYVPRDENGKKIEPKMNFHRLSWQKDSTNDYEQVEKWWAKWPEDVPLVNCGKSGIVVVDCDIKNGKDGIKNWCDLRGVDPDNDPLPWYPTPSGGRHYVFQADPKRPLQTSHSTLVDGVDVQAIGGPVFMYYDPGEPDELPPVPEIVYEHDGSASGGAESEEDDLPEDFGTSKWDVDVKAVVRSFTMQQAIDHVSPFLGKVERAEVGRIQEMANKAAVTLRHFVPEFWSADEAMQMILDALKPTEYDGPGVDKDVNPNSWDAYKDFLPVLKGQGTRKPKDDWRAVRVADRPQRQQEPEDEDQLVEYYRKRIKAQDRAKRLIAEEEFSKVAITLERATLADLLAQPEKQEAPFRIGRLHQVGYNTTITGQYKTGKSHLAGNLARALADDVPFLDEFPVLRPAGRIGILNYELTEANMLSWLRAMDIQNAERIAVLNLRGKPFSLVSERYQRELVKWLMDSEVETLILDPHRRAFAGFGKENDNDDVNAFTEVLDNIKYEANVADLFLTVHTGRAQHEAGAEHARGATALDDWVDQRWVMVRDGKDRYMYAEGRVSDVHEFRLAYDPATHRMWAEDGNRKDGKVEEWKPEILRLVRYAGQAGLNSTELHDRMKVTKKGALKPAIDALLTDGELVMRKGPNRSNVHYIPEFAPPEKG